MLILKEQEKSNKVCSGGMLHSLEAEQTNLWGSVLSFYSKDHYHYHYHIIIIIISSTFVIGCTLFLPGKSETNSSTLPLGKMSCPLLLLE